MKGTRPLDNDEIRSEVVMYYTINDVHVSPEWAQSKRSFDSVSKSCEEKAREEVTALVTLYNYTRTVEGSPP